MELGFVFLTAVVDVASRQVLAHVLYAGNFCAPPWITLHPNQPAYVLRKSRGLLS